MSKEIIGPVDEVTNVSVNLGPRIIMAGSEVLGTADNISIEVAQSTEEELEKLKSAHEIRLVKMEPTIKQQSQEQDDRFHEGAVPLQR